MGEGFMGDGESERFVGAEGGGLRVRVLRVMGG